MRPVPLVLGLAAAVAALVLPPSAAWALPFAGFTYDPERPLTQETVTFTSAATTDEGASIVSQQWDLDADGDFDDGSGPRATFKYVRPGALQVALRVSDSLGNSDTHRERLVVGNRAPTASFVVVPGQPAPGEAASLVSTSSDPDGFIASYGWDIDGDGAFDDFAGSSATVVFPTSGVYRIGLRVTDDSGAAATFVQTITASAAAGVPPSPATPGVPGPIVVGQSVTVARLLSPFPIVRVSGIVRRRGIRLRMLSVSGPAGATVSIFCHGRGCPFRRRDRTVAPRVRPAAGPTPATGRVRIKRFRRRLLRVGAAVRIYVTRPDAIGKYTRLRVRRGRLPARVDRCVLPGSSRPSDCPTG